MLGNPTLIAPGVLGDPRAIQPLGELVGAMITFDPAPIGRVTLVGIPMPNGRRLLAWYLTPSVAIDSVATARGWEWAALRMR